MLLSRTNLEAQLQETAVDIKTVCAEIKAAQSELDAAKASGDKDEVARLSRREEGLRKREESLRDKEKSFLSQSLQRGLPVQGTQQLNDGLPDAAARDLLATSAIVEELLSPKLTVLPAVDELLYFLEGRPRVRLPAMDVTVAQILAAQEAIDVRDWIERDSRSGAHTLGGLVSASVRWYDVFRTGRVCSEQVTGLAVKELLLGPMLMLDALRPPAQQLRLQFDRDSGDGASGITQASGTARPLRADTLLRASDCWRTLLKGEDKLEGNLGGAVKDLVRKMQVWDDAWYGELPYVLTYAAAGKRVGLYAVTRDDVDMRRLPRAVTRTYDMTDPSERLRLFCVAIQLYRILEAVNAALPPVVPPMDIPLVAESESRGTDGRPLWVPAP